MPIAKVQLEDGRIARLEVPEGTTPEQVQIFAEKQFGGMTSTEEVLRERSQGTKQLFDAIAPFVSDENRGAAAEAILNFDRGIVAGLGNILRGSGIRGDQPQAEQAREARLMEESTAANIGEFIGEGTPFAALAPIGGAAPAVGGLARAGQVALQAGLGASEAAILARGRGSDIESIAAEGLTGGAIAGGIEALSPKLFKLAGRIARKLKPGEVVEVVKDGAPIKELDDALKETGSKLSDLAPDEISALNIALEQELSLPQQIRQQRFDELGIGATLGDVTQDTSQQAQEQMLLARSGDPGSEPFRQKKLLQSEEFEAATNKIVSQLGVSDRAGKTIKDALSGRKDLLRKQKNALYKRAAESAPEVVSTPIFTDDIENALPSVEDFEAFTDINPTNAQAIENILVRFGVIKDPTKVKRFTDAGRTITPLTLGSFEDLRKAINNIERSDISGQTSVITGPIKRTLDEEAGFIDAAILESGVTDQGVVGTLKEARKRVIELKKEFSPQSVTGRLIDLKKDNETPVIEASKVVNELFRSQTASEQLSKTVKSLSGSDLGKKALGDLRAAAVANALEKALNAESRKISGKKVISGIAFNDAFKKLGKEKLKILFKGDKEGLKMLNKLRKVGLDLSPSAIAIPKGSAPVNVDIMTRMLNVPGLSTAVDIGKAVKESGKSAATARKAIKAEPQKVAKAALEFKSRYPRILSALGITQIEEEE